jgi:hypothetical protein
MSLPSTRRTSLLGWISIVAIAGGYYLLAIRPRLQFSEPLAFVGWTAIAALLLTGVFFAVTARSDPADLDRNHDGEAGQPLPSPPHD